jgi:hypothetical protein
MTTPEQWKILKIDNFYKVFATWRGGYLDGDSWKLNSGIVKIEEDGDFYLFHGYSGSIYKCHKNEYGSSSYTQGILESIINEVKDHTKVTELSPTTNWLELLD